MKLLLILFFFSLIGCSTDTTKVPFYSVDLDDLGLEANKDRMNDKDVDIKLEQDIEVESLIDEELDNKFLDYPFIPDVEVDKFLDFDEEELSSKCGYPEFPLLDFYPINYYIPFSYHFYNSDSSSEVHVSYSYDLEHWQDISIEDIVFKRAGNFWLKVIAIQSFCNDESLIPFHVKDKLPGIYGTDFSTAIPLKVNNKINPLFKAWASRVISISYGEDVDDTWKTPQKALGEAKGDSYDVVSLGRGGEIILSFDFFVYDGEGYDFAIFENSFSDNFLELGYVEVSSDGEHFVRFDTLSLTNSPVSAYGTLDPKDIEGFAGKYKQGFATPFDLSLLKYKPMVLDGTVDLNKIKFIKIVDVIGNGLENDSFGNPIYDPYPTKGSAGFDLDAIGLINIR